MKTEIAIFAAGCFWGVEEAFRKIKGVEKTGVGYTGGHVKNPTYEDVCTGKTGHAESVKVNFNPSVISYEKLLSVFWKIHDPTQANRQGPDFGTQYRSVIFYKNAAQKRLAEESKAAAQKKFSWPIVTSIVKATTFYRAEEYHQHYAQKNKYKNICGQW